MYITHIFFLCRYGRGKHGLNANVRSITEDGFCMVYMLECLLKDIYWFGHWSKRSREKITKHSWDEISVSWYDESQCKLNNLDHISPREPHFSTFHGIVINVLLVISLNPLGKNLLEFNLHRKRKLFQYKTKKLQEIRNKSGNMVTWRNMILCMVEMVPP